MRRIASTEASGPECGSAIPNFTAASYRQSSDQAATNCAPPSTRSTWPLTKFANGEAKNCTAQAISSGHAWRTKLAGFHRFHQLGTGLPGRDEARAERSPRRDHVDGYAGRAELLSETAGVVSLRSFRGGIDHPVVGSFETNHRTDIDDATGPALDHSRHHGAATQYRGHEIAIHHRRDILDRDPDTVIHVGLAALTRDITARVVDQQIDRTEVAFDLRYRRLHLGRIRNIRIDRGDGKAEAGDFVRDVLGGGCLVELAGSPLGTAMHRHRSPAAGQALRNRAAKATGGRGHPDYLSFQQFGIRVMHRDNSGVGEGTSSLALRQ